MPYQTNADLPLPIRKIYREHCQTVFRAAFNASLDEYDDEGKAFATAHAAAKKCMSAGKGMQPLKATIIDDDHFRLLAIPFGGPIPLPGAPKGADLDAEWFSERTDIKPDWLPYRLVDWHHGHDDFMGRTVIAKADNLMQEDEGWWVDVWLQRGERRLDLVRRLAERGATLYGSSESIAGMTKKAQTGEILVWPYWRQTLTTSPQNTYSILRPLKAVLGDLATDYTPSPSFWRELAASLDDLGTDLRATSGQGERGAKSGRVLSGANESALRDALDALGLSVTRLNEVLAKVRQLESS
jgi:cation transport regulator ChaB